LAGIFVGSLTANFAPMVSIEKLYQHFLQSTGVCTDTRLLKPGNIFVALRGDNFDGNRFVQHALENGAMLAIADDPALAGMDNVVVTDNALATLQVLAKYHRRQLLIPVLAITGSNGKTTTKELIHAVLSTTYKTSTTQGNLNNHIGVPLTLLRIPADAEIAVVEMGANHQKEIESYCTYTLPTHGLITNCGKAHLEGFGGVEGVRKGKGELFDYLRLMGGKAFACTDFDYFAAMAAGMFEVFWYGTSQGELNGKVIASDPFLTVELTKGFDKPLTIHTQLVGAYNVYNVLAACAVGRHFGVAAQKIAAAIAAYTPGNSRSQMVEKEGNHIVLDAYNANPTSMAAAIENFASLKTDNKMLFLGSMAELGPESRSEHENILELIGKYQWKQVVLVGAEFAAIPHPYLQFDTSEQAAEWWKDHFSTGNYLLVKGSRTARMEKLTGM
jgi:UDP-N-acetylmuramoyl-tripeptide--D-alanyl-D-alanine ligase